MSNNDKARRVISQADWEASNRWKRATLRACEALRLEARRLIAKQEKKDSHENG
jgi:hypothetical protein